MNIESKQVHLYSSSLKIAFVAGPPLVEHSQSTQCDFNQHCMKVALKLRLLLSYPIECKCGQRNDLVVRGRDFLQVVGRLVPAEGSSW